MDGIYIYRHKILIYHEIWDKWHFPTIPPSTHIPHVKFHIPRPTNHPLPPPPPPPLQPFLNPLTPSSTLEVRQMTEGGRSVPDAESLPVRSTEDVIRLMERGSKNRATGATALNERSSRSHR